MSFGHNDAVDLSVKAYRNYRYGFNGMEKDDEVKGSGNSYTTHFRMLDVRLGRWLSIDPEYTAWESPYASMGNTPILANDPEGDIIKIEGNLFFRVKTRIVIAKLMSTEEGMRVVSALQNDDKDWVIKNVANSKTRQVKDV